MDLLLPEWPAPPRVRAAMTLRQPEPDADLILADHLGEDPLRVRQSREHLQHYLRLSHSPGWLRQVHGTRVVELPAAIGIEADASWTTQPGRASVVLTADCLPVLFCDEDASVVASAHAGWRGLHAGVLEATVAVLPVAPSKLLAWLGPAIGPQAFEVGAEVREQFLHSDPAAVSAFVAGAAPGKFLADLYRLARQRLNAVGVTRIYGGGRCTYAETQYFHSYRRNPVCGRMASLIWLQP